MKKIIGIATSLLFVVGMSSCGGGHLCDAYNKADYTKYKAEQSKKIELPRKKK